MSGAHLQMLQSSNRSDDSQCRSGSRCEDVWIGCCLYCPAPRNWVKGICSEFCSG